MKIKMSYKGKLLLVALGLMVALGGVYWFFAAPPSSFPAEAELVERLNQSFRKSNAAKIQAVISLDDEHKYVPFISQGGNYSKSYWVWKKHQWQVARVVTSGAPEVWRIDPLEPTRDVVVWNLDPRDQVDHFVFYLFRDRYYRTSYDVPYYYPEVQLKSETVSSGEQTYGRMAIPQEWTLFLQELQAASPQRRAGGMFPFLHTQNLQQTKIGWMPYDPQGNGTTLEHSWKGSGFTTGGEEIHLVELFTEDDLK